MKEIIEVYRTFTLRDIVSLILSGIIGYGLLVGCLILFGG